MKCILARCPTIRWRNLLGVQMILLGVWLLYECRLARLLDGKCTETKPEAIRVEVKLIFVSNSYPI